MWAVPLPEREEGGSGCVPGAGGGCAPLAHNAITSFCPRSSESTAPARFNAQRGRVSSLQPKINSTELSASCDLSEAQADGSGLLRERMKTLGDPGQGSPGAPPPWDVHPTQGRLASLLTAAVPSPGVPGPTSYPASCFLGEPRAELLPGSRRPGRGGGLTRQNGQHVSGRLQWGRGARAGSPSSAFPAAEPCSRSPLPCHKPGDRVPRCYGSMKAPAAGVTMAVASAAICSRGHPGNISHLSGF